MISSFLVLWLISIINAVLSFLPQVTALPFNLDYYVQLGAGYFKAIAGFFPPLYTLFTVFMYYMAFRVTMLSLRLLRIIR